MFIQEDLERWYKVNNFQDAAMDMINEIRGSEPARNVTSGRRYRNVRGRFPSRRMGCTVQFESATVELPAIYMMERDTEVLEYYDQPKAIPIRYKGGKKQKVVGFNYTPDFFVLRKDGAGFEEWKTEEELIKLSIEMPNRYVRNDEGAWGCPPGEEYVAQFGFYFRVRSSDEINKVLFRNLRFLDDYLRKDTITVPDEVAEIILDTVEKEPGISTLKLLDLPKVTANHIYVLIIRGRIYFDLDNDLLADHDIAFVYRDKETAQAYQVLREEEIKPNKPLGIIKMEAGKKISWDGKEWTITNPGLSEITLTPSEEGNTISLKRKDFEYLFNGGKIQGLVVDSVSEVQRQINERLLGASEEDLKIANYRHNVVSGKLPQEDLSGIKETSRTIRNWKKAFNQAKEVYGFGLIGLLPNSKLQGNRCNHGLSGKSLDLMNEYITGYYETKTWPMVIRAYEAYRDECCQKGIPAVSEKTFRKFVNNRPRYEQTLNTQGPRAAYKYEDWYIEWDSPRHGDRIFELAHLDHTQLDIQLVSSRDEQNLGKPWLSLMIDAYSRRILAAYLTYDPPSVRSNMMLIRECVKRWGRLPMEIVVDNGSDFHSTYFETLLAMYEVTVKWRPSAKARFGTLIERIFGTTNTQFVHNLMGNTKIMKNYRQVTKSVDPRNLAVWTLQMFYQALLKYVYVVYDQRSHATLSLSPKEAFELSIRRSGDRGHIIAYDRTFEILTSPTPKSHKEVMVHPGSGVQIMRFNYWAEEFKDPRIQGKKVQVRYDPMDISRAWAFLHILKKWVVCRVEQYVMLRGRTEREIEVITKEYRKAKSKKHDEVTTKQLVEFMQENRENETILLQQRKDLELKQALRVIDGGKDRENSTSQAIQAGSTVQESQRNINNDNHAKDVATVHNPRHSFDWSQV